MVYNRDYNREWYKKNKEHRHEYLRRKITCECGAEVTIGSTYTHRRTTKHLKKMELI